MQDVAPERDNAKWPEGGGEMGARIRVHDWSRTSLGSKDEWPKTLKTAIDLMLRSPVAMTISWGSEGVSLYNDAFIPIAGRHHPGLLGCGIAEGWAEFGAFPIQTVRAALSGESLSFRDQEFCVAGDGGAQQHMV